MNPLVLWLEHHPRDTWSSQAVIDRYEQTYGPIPGTPAQRQQYIASARGQAYQRERVQRAIEDAHGNAMIGTTLAGILAFGESVAIRVLVHGTDVMGHSHRAAIDVVVGRTDRIRDLLDLAREAMVESAYGNSIQVDSIDILPGSHSA